MTVDVTDATFETDVLAQSEKTAVVVDLWAPWCGPCHSLGPILERVVDDTGGQVTLAKVNVDENPRTSAMFQVQGIPAVFALKDRKVVGSFIGAQNESYVRNFVTQLLPTEEESEIAALVAKGDEKSLRAALDLDPGHEEAVVALADLLVGRGESDEALALLERIPETAETRRVAARARVGAAPDEVADDVEGRLNALLTRVKDDEDARQEFIDLLELLGPDDPRTAQYRKQLTARLY